MTSEPDTQQRPGRVAEKQARFREALVAAATTSVTEQGIGGIRARDLAAQVGCSVGTIYTLFGSLDGLLLAVGGGTLVALDETMRATAPDAPPRKRLVALAHAYFGFARTRHPLWTALFEQHLPADVVLPEWHARGQVALFDHIQAPLAKLLPGAAPEELAVLARTLFSAVHGVVSLSLEERVAAVPLERVEDQLTFLIDTFVAGVQGSAPRG